MSGPIRLKPEKPLDEFGALGFTFTYNKDKRLGFVIRYKGKLRAYVNECRHIPIPLDYGDGDFFTTDRKYLFCRNHGAVYSPESGECLGGPCGGDPLRPLEVSEEGGEVLIRLPEELEDRG